MNFTHINKFLFLFIFIFILSSCGTKTIYDKIKIKKYEAPVIESFDEKNIELKISNEKKINYKNKLIIKEIKSRNVNFNNVLIENNKIYTLTQDLKILEFDLSSGNLISSINVDYIYNKLDRVVSYNYLNNSFIIGFKSGSIVRFNMSGAVIWKYSSNKTLNTKLTIFENQIVALYIDEIKSLSIEDGALIWAELYEALPVYQAKGGQLVNFLNLLFFILPNNTVGSIDFNLGTLHNSLFNELPLISSINNTKDKIHIYENYLVYLDEGKYLYTFDIFLNNFVLFKKKINLVDSNIFFNDSLILKHGNYLQAINIDNKKTFWLINDKKISKSSKILAVRSIGSNIEIFLNNGDILLIDDKKLININSLNVGNINSINFDEDNIIVNTKNGKTVIF